MQSISYGVTIAFDLTAAHNERMRLHSVSVRNFRCYKDEVTVEFGSLTALIGKNDSGKSTIFDALAIFFGEQKPDSGDASNVGNKSDMAITCEFDDIPSSIVIDASNPTNLADEFLLNKNGRLEITQVFNGSLATPKRTQIGIRALHPTISGANDLLNLKINELKTRAKELGVDLSKVNQSMSSEIREAIRNHVGDLSLAEVLIDVELQPGAKALYTQIESSMPIFCIFRSDRASTDQDSEAQDPMKVAVKLAIEDQKASLEQIAAKVREQVSDLVQRTLEKILVMAPELAKELTPTISDPKWDSVFKIALTSDTEIPLNKRGSGVRRLVLLGFLQAQAESKRLSSPNSNVIYAIEEPETSQHPNIQRELLLALEDLAATDTFQVMITTHTPMLGRLLPHESLRYIAVDEGKRTIHTPGEDTMRLVVAALGVLPDHDVKVFVGIEGKNDENFLKGISEIISKTDSTVDCLLDLETKGYLVFIPVAGSNAGLWVSRLKGLNRPEYHIFDRDFPPPQDPHYGVEADAINARAGCRAVHTTKAEIENYLHPDAIKMARAEVTLTNIGNFDDVPMLAAEMVHNAADGSSLWDSLKPEDQKKKSSRAKSWLNNDAVSHMTIELLAESDPDGELTSWLREITVLARNAQE